MIGDERNERIKKGLELEAMEDATKIYGSTTSVNCAKSFAHPDWCILATPENVMRLLTLQLYFSGGGSRRTTLRPYEII